MKRKVAKEATELKVQGIEGFFEKRVTKFGSGAKIDCPKVYLGRDVYVVIRSPRKKKETTLAPSDSTSEGGLS